MKTYYTPTEVLTDEHKYYRRANSRKNAEKFYEVHKRHDCNESKQDNDDQQPYANSIDDRKLKWFLWK